MSEQRLINVFNAKDAFEATLMKSVLEDEGIKAHISGNVLTGDSALGWMMSPQVLVFEHDAPRARQLIREHEELRRTTAHETGDEEADGDFEQSAGDPKSPTEPT